MRFDTRLSGMLHVLLHMVESGKPVTSEAMASYLGTNAVVVRRTMAGLRDAGLVRSEKGHGGGWVVARAPSGISLGDVYSALGSPTLFAIGNRNENPNCLIEKAVNASLGETLGEAEALVVARLHNISLADVADTVGSGMEEFKRVMSRGFKDV